MIPKELARTPQNDLLPAGLVIRTNLQRGPCRPGEKINWTVSIDEFGAFYSKHPALPIHLMAGLHYLKQAFGLSDEIVVKSGVENLCRQKCYREEYFQHRLPIDLCKMTCFRTRLGASVFEKRMQLKSLSGIEGGALKPSSFTRATIDTTVQKAVTFPTDGHLYQQSSVWLIRLLTEAIYGDKNDTLP